MEPATDETGHHGLLVLSPRRGPHRTTRQISAATWQEMRGNYPAAAGAALDG